MAFRFRLLVALLYGSAATAAELSAQAHAEIDHLLAYLAQSGCRFERNGTWWERNLHKAETAFSRGVQSPER